MHDPGLRAASINVAAFAGPENQVFVTSTPNQLLARGFDAILGWLGMIHKHFPRRDISSYNLILLHAWRYPESNFDSEGKGSQSSEIEAACTRLQGSAWDEGITPARFAEQMAELSGILKDLGIPAECTIGALIDEDIASKMRGPLSLEHHMEKRSEAKQGTPEFMSKGLLEAMIFKTKDYLQFPIDDLYSFYLVAQWSAVYHDAPVKSAELSSLRTDISGNYIHRTAATVKITGPRLPEGRYGPFLASCQPVLRDWFERLRALDIQWGDSDTQDMGKH